MKEAPTHWSEFRQGNPSVYARSCRSGYGTLLSARVGQRYVFLHGFSKSDVANITHDEKKALQFAGKVFLDLAESDLMRALQAGVLLEVCCDNQTH